MILKVSTEMEFVERAARDGLLRPGVVVRCVDVSLRRPRRSGVPGEPKGTRLDRVMEKLKEIATDVALESRRSPLWMTQVRMRPTGVGLPLATSAMGEDVQRTALLTSVHRFGHPSFGIQSRGHFGKVLRKRCLVALWRGSDSQVALWRGP